MRSRSARSPGSVVICGASIVAVLVAHRAELVLDDRAQLLVVGEDRLQLGDGRAQLFELVAQLLPLERGEPAELQVEDVAGLDLGELEGSRHQRGAGRVGRFGTADQGDDRVDHVERAQQAFDDVRAVARLAQAVLAPAGDDLDLVRDVDAQRLLQVEQPRHTVDERQDVRREVRLHRRVLVELVQHDLGVRIALQVDDEPHRVAGRRVAHVADALDLAVVHELGDLLPDHLDRRLVRHLGDDDAQTPRLLDDLGDRAHPDRPAAGAVRLADADASEDRRSGREVGTEHELHQVFDRRVRVVDEVQRRVDDLAQVVRRDVRGHADRDAAATVHEQVREARRQHERLLVLSVVRLAEVDGLLVDLAEQLHRELREPRFGVARCRGPVGRVGRTEVPVPVDQRIAQREVLRHARERVVDRLVAVRVVVRHHVADRVRGLAVLAVGPHALDVHPVEDAPLHRLQPVARVGKCARRDDRHRVVQEGAFHLLLDLDRFDVAERRQRFVRHTRPRVRGCRSRERRIRCRGSGRLWRSPG